MSDDDPEQEQEMEERETSVDREEREHRRMNDDSDEADASGGSTSVDDIPSRPDQPVGNDEELDNEANVGKDEEQMDVPQIMVDHPSIRIRLILSVIRF